MKKNLFACFLAAATLCGVVSSCSDSGEEVFAPQVTEETVFVGENLALTYSDEALAGKQVKFIPNTTDNTKATIELKGNAISLPTMEVAAGLNTPGVVPGESLTTIEVTLVNTASETTFEGEDKTATRTINYSGRLTKEKLELDLNVTINNDFSGKSFDLVPYVETGKDKSSPITLDWSSTNMVPFLSPSNKVEMNWFIRDLLGSTKFIPTSDDPKDNINIAQALALVLKQVSFLPDGNVVAQYKDGFTDTEWKTSPKNLATYSVAENGKIRLYLNVEAIIAAASAPESKSRLGVADLLPVLLKHGARMLSEGITITYNDNNGVAEFYLDQETVFNVLNDLIPFFNDKDFVAEVVGMILDLMPSEGELAQFKPLAGIIVKDLLNSIPSVMEGTTNLHFGINTTLAE